MAQSYALPAASAKANTWRAQINDNTEALRSQFAGTPEPTDPVAGQAWFDENSANGTLKVRNKANNAWVDVLVL